MKEKRKRIIGGGGKAKRRLLVAAFIVAGLMSQKHIYAERLDQWIEDPDGNSATSDQGIGLGVNNVENNAIKRAIDDYLNNTGNLDAIKAAIEIARGANALPTAKLTLTGDRIFTAQLLGGEEHIVVGKGYDYSGSYTYTPTKDMVSIDINGNGQFIINSSNPGGVSTSSQLFHSSVSGGAFYLGGVSAGANNEPLLILTGNENAKFYITDQQGIYGAAILNLLGYTYLEHTIFDTNHNGGYGEGGAIYNYGYTVIDNSDFINNYASQNGGAIVSYGPIYISNSNFIKNSTTTVGHGEGGALLLEGNTNTVENSSFIENSSSGNGGAIYVGDPWYSSPGSLKLIADDGNIVFAGNYRYTSAPTVSDGGAIYAYAGSTINLTGEGNFYVGDKNSTSLNAGTNVDNIDSIYMGAGATFTYNGHPENGFLQLVGSHEIDTSGGGDFKIDYANLRIVNDAASESLNTHAVFNVHDSILSGQGKIVTDSFSFDNSKFSPDSAVLWTDLSAGHLTRTQFDALTAADAERIGELQIDAAASGITIIADAHYYVDLDPANSRNDKITITGAVNGTPTMNIDAFFGSAPTSMTPITILSASGGHNISVGTFTDNTPAVLQAAHMQAKVTTDANNIYIAFDPVTADLIWKGQPNMTWENNSSRVNWFVDDGTNQADSFFLDGDSVTFKSGAAGSTEGIVTVDAAGVNPARIYMDNGGTYTFTGGDINVTGDFQIQNAYVTINNKVTAAHVNADSQTLTLDNADITAEVNYNGYNKLLVVNPSKITGNLNINSGTLSIVVPDYASATASASTPMLDVISGNIILGSPYYKLIELDTTALTAPGFSVGDKIVVARAASSITKPDDISYDALPAGGDFREKQMKLAAEVAGNELYLAVKAFGPITWKNVTGKGQTGNMTWEAVGDPIWEDEDGKETEFYTNDDVIFAGAGQGDITVKDPVYPNSVQIKNGAYSFSGASVNVMNDTAVNNATVSFTSDLTTNQLDIQNKSDVTLKNETTAAQITVRASTLTLDGAKITLNGIGASQGYLDVGGQSKLNIYNYPDITGDLKISGEMTYYVPDGFKVADGIALMTVSRDSNITDSTIDVRIPGTGEPLHPSDEIILLGSNTITGTPKNIIVANDTIKVEFGTTLAYSLFELSVENNKLIARLAADLSKDFALAAALEKDKVLSEAYLGGIAALNAGGDLIGESGIRSLVDGFKTLANRFDYHGFAVTQGGYTRYDTGSHVDLKSFSVAAGLSKGVALKKSEFVWGAFFEYGNGSYDTFNSFAGAGYVHGKGNIRYFGGGLLGRLDFSGDKASSYFEGSIRAGRVRNHYDGSAASDVASYDASATYAGFHVGAGTVLSLSEKAKLDLSAKYFLTRTGSETVTLSSGEEVAFDAAKSSRLRLGARLSPNKSARFRPYAAAYYEYEFDGAAKAEIVAAGLPIASPSLKGATGIGEVGVVFQPSAFIPFTVDVALQGYTGKRKGVTGTLHFQYRF